MEEKNYDAHRVTQRALLTVEAPESALMYKLWALKTRSAAPGLVWFVQTGLKVGSQGGGSLSWGRQGFLPFFDLSRGHKAV